MISLKNWRVLIHTSDDGMKYCSACGVASGHPEAKEGMGIVTNDIGKIMFDSSKNRILFSAHSQNIYFMDLATICFCFFEHTALCLSKMNIFIPTEKECLKLAENLKTSELQKVRGMLKDNELYLKMGGLYVQKAFWKKGEIREIPVTEHRGMFHDSYLITDWEQGEVDFRYTDRLMSIEPYHYSDGLEAVLIDNIGTEDFACRGGSTEKLCMAGMLTRLEKKDFDVE